MKPNMGTTDRILRVLIGFGIVAYGVINHTWLGAIGIVPILTALVRFCPAYLPFGICTIDKSDKGGGGCCGGKCN